MIEPGRCKILINETGQTLRLTGNMSGAKNEAVTIARPGEKVAFFPQRWDEQIVITIEPEPSP